MKNAIFLLLMVAMLLPIGVQAQTSIGTVSGTNVLVDMAKYDPYPAQADDFVTVWFDVSNRGTESAENVTFTLLPKYPFSLPDNDPTRTITQLSGLTSKRIEYRLLVDKNAPEGRSEMEIKYSRGPGVETSKKFNITVNNSIEQAALNALFVSAKPSPAPGILSTISMDVVNADKGAAYYVLAKAESSIATIERNEIFIGTLEPNDFDNVDYELKINENTEPGKYPVDITFYYRDKDSNLITEKDVVEIEVLSKTDSLPAATQIPQYMYVIYIIVLLIAIRLLIPFFKWFVKPFRRRKK
jgi:hypothetical protein